ncbi:MULTISPECIES: CppA N-terminal domain-containing protein [unclassified Enterococcus]|uniref:CppA N-terminal domain-containing protein n=1 Tax=unclassified Enterococcus TaxID=2608891 RepID=UPI001555ABDF|nr:MULTISPECIES: CppA N-terminal domain-containing protein [unclassified Enterococcus]MBS7577928.1 hypothetical protein [Enterococcus sp. MMGLQ5-2]MBS7585211.1 hypothetical protein [Enterococcus sp. MMGLQ5-1]NPD13068.1 hypothetical protein [Enterococcus sp. MMGLQ5-1]NPD37758.1 hypothetical protein [Enterococcus sp. MMGLQ5-2]
MIESILKKASLKSLALRINHRASNIDFYQNKLGFKKLLEEGALTFFGDKGSSLSKLILEETPSYRGRRTIDGIKKINALYFQVGTELDFDSLAKNADQVVETTVGKSAYFLSPEGDKIVLTLGEMPSKDHSLPIQPAERVSCDKVELESITPSKIKLNVSDLEEAIQKYEQIFDLSFQANQLNFPFEQPFALELIESEGKELEGFVDEIWDIEFIEILVSEQADLATFAEYFETQNLDYFIDAKKSLLTVKDASELEWWFVLK